MLEVSYSAFGGLRNNKNDQDFTERSLVDGDCLQLKDIRFTNSISIDFRDNWIFNPYANFSTVKFVDCEFLGDVVLWSDDSELQFLNCTINKLLEIKSALKRISLDGTSVHRFLVSCENRHFPEIEMINHSTVLGSLQVNHNTVGTFKILKSLVAELSLDWIGVQDLVIRNNVFNDSVHLNCEGTKTANISRNKGSKLNIHGLSAGRCVKNSFDSIEFKEGFPEGVDDNRFKTLILDGGDLSDNYESLNLWFKSKSRSEVQLENISSDGIDIKADRIKRLIIKNCSSNQIKIEVEDAALIKSDLCKSELHTIRGINIKTVQVSNYEGQGNDVTYIDTKSNKATLLKDVVTRHLELEQIAEAVTIENATLASFFVHDSSIDYLRGSNIGQPEDKGVFTISHSHLARIELIGIESEELNFSSCASDLLKLEGTIGSINFSGGKITKGELEVTTESLLLSEGLSIDEMDLHGGIKKARLVNIGLDNLYVSNILVASAVDNLKGLFLFGTTDLESLSVSEMTVMGVMECANLKGKTDLRLTEMDIGSFSMFGSEATDCTIQDSIFEEIIFKNSSSSIGENRKIELVNVEVTGLVSFSKSRGNKRIEVTSSQIKNLAFRSVSAGYLQIDETAIEAIDLNGYSGDFRLIEGSKTKLTSGLANKLLEVRNCHISNFEVAKFSLGDVRIENLHPWKFNCSEVLFKSLLLRDFRMDKLKSQEDTEGQMSFVNKLITKSKGNLTFDNCDLSRMRFNSCFFESFEELNVRSSKLDEIKCTSTTWPTKVKSEFNNEKDDNFEVREACRQLKMAMANHHDRINELKFHALEMNAYEKIVRATSLRKNWNDKFSLLGGLTNDFGLNWWKPVLLGFFIVLAHYILLIGSHYSIDCWQELQFHFNTVDFLTLFNPTHRIDHLSLRGSIGPGAAIWDTSSRIFSSFFIYQTVVAFRKFRK